MSCDEFRSVVFEFALGELSVEAAEKAAEHIEKCSRCREEYEAVRELVETLESLGGEPAPQSLLPGVMKKISAEKAGRKKFNIVRFGTAAAAAAVLVVCSVSVLPKLADRHNAPDSRAGQTAGAEDPSKNAVPLETEPKTEPENVETTEGATVETMEETANENTDAGAVPDAAVDVPSAASYSGETEAADSVESAPSARSGGQTTYGNEAVKSGYENAKKEKTPENGTPDGDGGSGTEWFTVLDAEDDVAPTAGGADKESAETALSADGDGTDTVSVEPRMISIDDDRTEESVPVTSGRGGGGLTAGGGSGGSGYGFDSGGNNGVFGAEKYICRRVIFTVPAQYASAAAVDTAGKSFGEVAAELDALGVGYRVDVEEEDMTAEHASATPGRRAEIEELCAAESCVIFVEEDGE